MMLYDAWYSVMLPEDERIFVVAESYADALAKLEGRGIHPTTIRELRTELVDGVMIARAGKPMERPSGWS